MIIIKLGDITKEAVDVVVNAANAGLRGGGGVDGAIHRVAGPQVMDECRRIGGCPTGEAVMTGPGHLCVKKIIHAVGPVWRGGAYREAQLLQSCYRNSFLLAQKGGFRSIALPAISTGAYGYPIGEAAAIALFAGLEFEKAFEEIRYVCFSESDAGVYKAVWENIRNQRSDF